MWPTEKSANAMVMKWDLSALPADAEVQSAIFYQYYLESDGGVISMRYMYTT